MKIQVSKILALEEFLDYAEEIFPVPIDPFAVRDLTGRTIGITPGLVSYNDLVVVAGDWIPITRRGEACLQQMIHSPGLYLGKEVSRLQMRGDVIEAEVSALHRHAGRAALIGGAANYYHWLVDYLPRLIVRRRYGPPGEEVILLDDSNAPYQAESLAMLGLGDLQVMRLARTEAVRFDETIVPTLLSNTTVAHKAVPSLLRSSLGWEAQPARRRVYLSRQDASSRRLGNEAELVRLLESYGFERHVPAQMSLKAQMELCAGAEALIAVHGAAMANILFCAKGTKVFEIFTPLHKVSAMKVLSNLCGCQHHFVPARNLTFGADGNALLGDWEVDLDAARAVLAERLA